jgi:hypothetical protein
MTRQPALPFSARLLAGFIAAIAGSPTAVQAQVACSSDGQRAPVALMERFINADCADCWRMADTPRAPQGTVALDWIIPGAQGDDAPLSAAALREAAERLQARGLSAPETTAIHTTPAHRPGGLRLRVAQGPALNGYLGASIALQPAHRLKTPVTAWLALVETIPPGIEDSPVERNLVRNVLTPAWNGPDPLSKSKSGRFFESRPMSIPAGANPARLRVIGWVQDQQGRIQAIAQSHCASTP